jgi:hypothetical protein
LQSKFCHLVCMHLMARLKVYLNWQSYFFHNVCADLKNWSVYFPVEM